MHKKIERDEHGIAHILLIVLGVVVIAGVATIGWKVAGNNKKTSGSTNSSTNSSSSSSSNTGSGVSADATCLGAFHDVNLCHFAGNSTSFNKTAYTATLTIVQQGGTTSTTTLKNDGKGNTDLTSSVSGQVINAITLDGVTYIQANGSGPWIEYLTGTNAPTSNPTSNMNIGVGASGVKFKSLGQEVCGSLTCYKYQVSTALTPAATQTIWFDTNSYQLREWKYSDDSGNATDMKITYGAVTITKPSPVESLSALSGSGSGGSNTAN